MKFFKTQSLAKFQQGALLLVLFFVLFVFGSTIFLSASNYGSIEARQKDEVRYQMELAKAALISYALNYETFNIDGDGDGDFDDEGPGHLPCPDFDNNPATKESSCSISHERGRLPEYIDLPSGSRFQITSYNRNTNGDPNNGCHDQKFWYAVSDDFREGRRVRLDRNPQFSIDGIANYVAVIIAPGEALASQNRSCTTTNAANYLESFNAIDDIETFVNSNPDDPDNFNDMVLGITWSEIMTAMALKAVQEIKAVLDRHHDTDYIGYEPLPDYPGNGTGFWDFPDTMERAALGNSYASPWQYTMLSDFDWYGRDTDEGGDRWNEEIIYNRINSDTAEISFRTDGERFCAITFTITHDGGITRDRPFC